jgi:hypothetical protein
MDTSREVVMTRLGTLDVLLRRFAETTPKIVATEA